MKDLMQLLLNMAGPSQQPTPEQGHDPLDEEGSGNGTSLIDTLPLHEAAAKSLLAPIVSEKPLSVGRHPQPGSQTVLPPHRVPFLSTAYCIILPNHLTTT